MAESSNTQSPVIVAEASADAVACAPPARPQTAAAAFAGVIASASKIAFLLLALTACVGFILGKLESGDFMMLAGMAFAFYFSNKGETGPSAPPYAGK